MTTFHVIFVIAIVIIEWTRNVSTALLTILQTAYSWLTESTPADIRPLEIIPAKFYLHARKPSDFHAFRREYLQNPIPAKLETFLPEYLHARIPAELNTCKYEYLLP